MKRWAARAVLVLCVLATFSGAAAAQEASADRMVAEWMLRMGGSIVLEGQRRPIYELADLPATDFRIQTLNFTWITMYAASLQDELRRLPPLPHLKELYLNGRLWYDQPAPRVAATIELFAGSTELEKLVLSKPVQTYIPFNDAAIKGLAPLTNLKELRVHQTRSSGVSLAPFPLTHLDLNYVVMFNDVYKDFGGVKFPTRITQTEGGFPVNEFIITDVQPNAPVDLPVPANVQSACVPAVRAESSKIADGVWVVGGGSHHSVVVEFNNFITVIEGPLTEAR